MKRFFNTTNHLKSVSLLYLLFGLTYIGCSQKPDLKKMGKLDEKALPIIYFFFEKVKSNEYSTAIESLLKKNENIDLKDSSVLMIQDKFIKINETSGKFITYNLVRKKKINDDLGIFICIAKYEKKFYRFIFMFYNNDIEVKIYKFSFDDHIDIELEESQKFYSY